MADINIDMEKVKIANSRLPSIRNDVNNVINTLRMLQSTIDQRILNRRDLRVRLSNARNNIASLESDLQNLHMTVAHILQLYEENERILISRVPNINLMKNFD